MNTFIFPSNELGASICPIFNGHIAIVSHNTDRLIDHHYALAEMYAFKHNVQCTSFLHAFGETTATTLNGETFFENTNYGETLKAVHNSGRISFGLYWRSDIWVNPLTGVQETIPDYYSKKWTSLGKQYFPKVVVDSSKSDRYPNHGQQLFDESEGAFGYDMINQAIGVSNLSETYLHTEQQLNHIREISGLDLTSGSFTNGAQGGWNVLMPKLFGMRNSAYGYSGSNGNIKYSGLSREEMMMQASTCRGWDAVNAGQITNQVEALNYSASEIDRAIVAGGLYSEFMHWHSLYRSGDTAFFEPFMQMINTAINGRDVWRAGNNEVNEYYVIANSIERIGSYMARGKAYIAIQFKDLFIASDTNGISNAIDPTRMTTPISISIDLNGTSLAGKNIYSRQAQTVRNLGLNIWIVNVSPINTFKNGAMLFEVEEAFNNDQLYDAASPTLTISGSTTVTANKKAKFVVWRKSINSEDKVIEAVHRTTEFSESLIYPFDISNYKYYVGGISKSRVSNLLSI
ncbi:hypothetical protein GWP85_13380 [Acinetobacter beijerinckii]|uniref:hypothetical protein n=1 Tax=Acinetobacter beijerinckii TaxID=262668 RepID=UPI0023DDB0F6|nr:hypothetical protein [Acinetobacter beijerinckii]MDF2418487.1 hypothetical protein [Acinetobacter beijerinckii]